MPDNIFCWGFGSQGQLGLGNTNSQIYPRKLNFNTVFTQLSAGQDFTCGLTGTDLYCWGDNSDGQLGTGQTPITTPFIMQGVPGVEFLPLSLGASGVDAIPDVNGGHSCFVLADGKLVCLGLNDHGQLGINSIINTSTPTNVTIEPVKQIALGTQFSCALLQQGALRCWGRNHLGQLGIGTIDDHSTPQPVKWPSP
jgi:alpha-tubulin suppressor-like RCC1 family protein